MSSRVEKALELHGKGYNCAQAVACAYCDLVGMDETTVFKASEAFGAGMGGLQSTCGAVSGAVLIAGLKNSSGTIESPTKGTTYEISKDIIKSFKEKNQSIVCKDLKGVETQKALRSCDGCIEDASRILENYFINE